MNLILHEMFTIDLWYEPFRIENNIFGVEI